MTIILYSKISKEFQDECFETHINTIPEKLKNKINAFRRWQDKQTSLLGLLLLRHGISRFSDSQDDPLHLLKYNSYGKPFLDIDLDFNISHSGDFTFCIISNDNKVGIDIEKIRDIDVTILKSQMTVTEWENIVKADSVKDCAFKYWTQKEAVVKAIGKGLSIALSSFAIVNDKATIDSDTWHVYPLPINIDGYSSHIAINKELSPIELPCEFVNFYKS
ncbi:4'-phosphopantetheinyl transferase family protein [Aquimarina algiphila]|uniref:4'-phosphopantetheinyl transferase family protein n=1 Tax=Aquimarina algiphila TaxID=2047982 RepID=UPI00232CE9E7|nr:4'-phosphopantetheinyl transferase superfamily protein [Aquimarina algiphila]